MTQHRTDLIGQMVGKFRIDRLIGEGAMGSVYEAEDTSLGRRIALKLLKPGLTMDPADVERFKREARSAAALRHDNIVTIYEVGQIDQLYYIAMDYIEGKTLEQIIQQEQSIPLNRIIVLLEPVASALDTAHAQKIVHRDIKPANIMQDASGKVYLMDFGIARHMDAQRTAAGIITGTPIYMSPEQARGDTNVGPATDIYALGVMVYQMLSGNIPFEGATTMLMLFARLQEPPRPLRDFVPAIDPALEQAVMRALEPEPDKRYASASQFIAALKSCATTTTAADTVVLSSGKPSAAGTSSQPAGQAPASAGGTSLQPAAQSSAPAAGSRKTGPPVVLMVVVAVLLLLGGGGLAAFFFMQSALEPSPTIPAGTATAVDTATDVPATPTTPAPAPAATFDNQLIVVVGDNGTSSLWVMNADGSARNALPASEGGSNPDVSPDGRMLAFDMGGDIYAMNADASRMVNLTGGEGNNTYPAWSPDGSRIAFVRDRNIYVMNADGSGTAVITDEAASYRDLVWARGGSELLAFEMSGDIYVINPDGSAQTNLTRSDARDEEPAWSPDGSRIAFASDQNAETFDIYVMSAEGRNITRLTTDPALDKSPAWSPDGSQIVFRTARDRNDELYVMASDGNNQIRITDTDVEEMMVVWSPAQ